MLKPKLAVSTSVLQAFDVLEWPARLQELRAASFAGVGVNLRRPEQIPPAANLRAMLDSAGLAVAWVEGEVNSALDPEQQFQGFRQEAEALGTATICLMDCGAAAKTERETVARLTRFWKHLARQAAVYQQRVLWHPVTGPDLKPTSTGVIASVLRAVDEPNFGVVFDTGFLHDLAQAEGHEQIEDGRPIRGVLGLVDRYKGWIGSILLTEYLPAEASVGGDQGPLIDWNRLIPSLADAWVPDAWWTLDRAEFASTGAAARSLLGRLAPYLSELSHS